MSSTFFEAADTLQSKIEKMQHRLYFDEHGAIIDISYDELDHDKFIYITQEEYDCCFIKREDYIVIDEKLVFSPPVQRAWNLEQSELQRNPYTWKNNK